MNYPDSRSDWLRFGTGSLLLLLGLVVALVNWCILFYNIWHVLIKKDDKHSSYVPLIAFLGIVAGGYLLSPFRPHLAWLVLLDALSFLCGLVLCLAFRKNRQMINPPVEQIRNKIGP